MSSVNERGFDCCLASKAKNVHHSGKRKGHTWRSGGTWPVWGRGWSPRGTGKAQHVTSLSSSCPRPGPGSGAKGQTVWPLGPGACSRLETPDPLLLLAGRPLGWEGGYRKEGNAINRSGLFILKQKEVQLKKQLWALKEGHSAHKEEWSWEPGCPEMATCSMSKASQVPSLNTHR